PCLPQPRAAPARLRAARSCPSPARRSPRPSDRRIARSVVDRAAPAARHARRSAHDALVLPRSRSPPAWATWAGLPRVRACRSASGGHLSNDSRQLLELVLLLDVSHQLDGATRLGGNGGREMLLRNIGEVEHQLELRRQELR